MQVIDENLLTRPERWILVFLDFKYPNFDKNILGNRTVNSLTFSSDLCCLLQKLENCLCPDSFSMLELFLSNILDQVTKIIENLVERYELPSNLECSSNKFNDEIRNKFYESLDKSMIENDLYLNENGIWRIKVTGNLELVNGYADNEIIAKYYGGDSFSVVTGKKIKPIKPFYRIGVTHVSIIQDSKVICFIIIVHPCFSTCFLDAFLKRFGKCSPKNVFLIPYLKPKVCSSSLPVHILFLPFNLIYDWKPSAATNYPIKFPLGLLLQ